MVIIRSLVFQLRQNISNDKGPQGCLKTTTVLDTPLDQHLSVWAHGLESCCARHGLSIITPL